MSKGTKTYALRIAAELADQVEKHIVKNRHGKIHVRSSFSEFVRQAIREKLAHLKRSKKTKPKLPQVCIGCGTIVPVPIAGASLRRLDGILEYYCTQCVKPLE